MTWQATVLTLYPQAFPGPLGVSLMARARDEGRWALQAIDIRDHARDKHRTVDDTPAGGGPGMVLRADVLGRAIDAARVPDDQRPCLLMSARGAPLSQKKVREFVDAPGLIIVCGRFEGVDERIIAGRDLMEVSIGDYVLAGGEAAAMVILEACVRLLPGVMGDAVSAVSESFEDGLLEYPQYTRPQIWEGHRIPDVLVSGDHGKIAAWRHHQAETLTRVRRPDLWSDYQQSRRPRGNKR